MSAVKSQWTIPVQDEIACFNAAFMNNWHASNAYWGIHNVGGVVRVIGSTPASPWAYIAKFVGPIWHGYPVVHWVSPYDRPKSSVLSAWVRAGYIRRTIKSKIIRGKKCAL